ncbi:MAG: 4-hydroxythreonine-4-phosphate dehydrogenase PdxA [Candidatus Poribacteria bacterium]|nr:4-hydroxythreonine-4-phosphate dehydrogenase PdxA [Candidatus Poribacteria bacterium]
MLVGITMGDACGLGPEILLRSVAGKGLSQPFVVFGDLEVLEFARDKLNLNLDFHPVTSVDDAKPERLNVFDCRKLRRMEVTIGKVSVKAGAAAVKYVQVATEHALEEKIDAIVTLPINKAACRHTFPNFQGHTEFIAGMCGVADYVLSLVAPKLIVTHVSTHVSLKNAVNLVKRKRVLSVLQMTHAAAKKLFPRAKIAVAGLNPHAGEDGAFGSEEIEEIIPAIREAQRQGIDAHGPIAPDTLFMKALAGDYDAVVCMYHDQGHIPMKLHGFHETVNVTLGLPIIRTSVDHGTGFDIAYKGVASTQNFMCAFNLAVKLASSK